MIHTRLGSLLILLPSALTLLAGCSGSDGIDTSKPLTPETVIAHVQQRNAGIVAMTANGALSIDTPEYSGSGFIDLSMLKPDSMMFDISAAFGVRVARGLVTSNRFIFYNGLENTVAEGATTSRNLKNILRLSIEFSDAFDILIGGMNIKPLAPSMRLTGVHDGNTYRVQYSGEQFTEEYLVDLSYGAVRKYIRRSTAGEIVEDITFRDFRKKEGIYLPGIISIERPGASESLSVTFQQQSLNDLPVDFTFRVPKSATKIQL